MNVDIATTLSQQLQEMNDRVENLEKKQDAEDESN
jgi:hypothetical protein